MIPELTQAYALLLKDGNLARLEDLLGKHKQDFEKKNQIDYWQYWWGQLLLAKNDYVGAMDSAATITEIEMKEALLLDAMRLEADLTKNHEKLLTRLKSDYDRHGQFLILFEWAELSCSLGKFQEVSPYAHLLVAKLQTPQAVKIAAFALFNTEDFAQCAKILDDNHALFASRRLPSDLRRLRISCEQKLGRILQAIQHAESLASESDHIIDKTNLISLRLASGDIQGATLGIRTTLEDRKLSAEESLRFAMTIQDVDKPLAIRLLEDAWSKGLTNDEHIVHAYFLAHRVGSAELLEKLHPKFLVSASKTNAVKAMPLNDVIAMMKSSKERMVEIGELYRSGSLPIHLVAEQHSARLSIARLLQLNIQPNLGSSQYYAVPVVFVQHGGRIPGVIKRKCQRLYCDITSLLLINELGLLDALKLCANELFVPSCVFEVLRIELNKISHHQPLRIETIRVVSDLIGANKIGVHEVLYMADNTSRFAVEQVSLYNEAVSTGGYFVTYLPVDKERHSLGDNPKEGAIVGCNAILHSLGLLGVLSNDEIKEGKGKIAGVLSAEAPVALNQKSKLFLDHGIAETLSEAGCLVEACDSFSVFLGSETYNDVKRELRNEHASEKLRGKLNSMIDWLRTSINNGTLQIIPNGKASREADFEDKAFQSSQAIIELLHAPVAEDAFVCIDDRFLNSFAKCGEIPICTLVDVLLLLRETSGIDQDTFWSSIHLLRECNLRHIPILEGEISKRLFAAQVANGRIIESPELRTLRRYIAILLADPDSRQLPDPSKPGHLGETQLVLNVIQSIRSTFEDIWTSDSAEKVALGNWVIENIWSDAAFIAEVLNPKPDNRPNLEHLLGSSLAQLYFHGITLKTRRETGSMKSPNDLRKLYFDWLLWNFGTEKENVELVGKQLREMLSHPRWLPIKSSKVSKLQDMVIGEWFLDLPVLIRDSVNFPANVLKRYRIRHDNTIGLNDLRFNPEVFWQGIERVLRGKPVTIAALQPGAVFEITFLPDKACFVFKNKKSGSTFEVTEEGAPLANRDASKRTGFLMSNLSLLDMPLEKAKRKARVVCAIDNVTERLKQFDDCRRKSFAYSILELGQRHRAGGNISVYDLQSKGVIPLLNYLRIDESIEDPVSKDALAASWAELLADCGLTEGFARFSTIPLFLPSECLSAFDKKSETEAKELIGKWLIRLKSPVSRINLLSLIAKSRHCVSLTEEVITIVDWMRSGSAEIAFEGLQSSLMWSYELLNGKSYEQPVEDKLRMVASWIHAGSLQNALDQLGNHLPYRDYFNKVPKSGIQNLLSKRESLRDDVCYPRNLSFKRLFVFGLIEAVKQNEDFAVKSGIGDLLKSLLFIGNAGTVVPDFSLLQCPDTFRNRINSYLGFDGSDALVRITKDEAAATFKHENLLADAQEALDRLLDKSEELNSWLLVAAYSGPTGLCSLFREKVVAAIDCIKVENVCLWELRQFRIAMFWVGNEARNLRDKGLKERLRCMVLDIARIFSEQDMSNEDIDDRVPILMELCFMISECDESDSDRAMFFTTLVKEVSASWRKSAASVQTLVNQLILKSPFSIALRFAQLQNELRIWK